MKTKVLNIIYSALVLFMDLGFDCSLCRFRILNEKDESIVEELYKRTTKKLTEKYIKVFATNKIPNNLKREVAEEKIALMYNEVNTNLNIIIDFNYNDSTDSSTYIICNSDYGKAAGEKLLDNFEIKNIKNGVLMQPHNSILDKLNDRTIILVPFNINNSSEKEYLVNNIENISNSLAESILKII